MDDESTNATPDQGGRLTRLEALLRIEQRPLPGARVLRTGLRTAHLAAMGALYGGHIFGVEAGQLLPALIATLATGGGLIALDVYRAPIWIVQIRGLATLAKMVLVACVAVYWDHRIALLTLVLVIGSINSHMPARWRYYSVLQGRVVGTEEKG